MAVVQSEDEIGSRILGEDVLMAGVLDAVVVNVGDDAVLDAKMEEMGPFTAAVVLDDDAYFSDD